MYAAVGSTQTRSKFMKQKRTEQQLLLLFECETNKRNEKKNDINQGQKHVVDIIKSKNFVDFFDNFFFSCVTHFYLLSFIYSSLLSFIY